MLRGTSFTTEEDSSLLRSWVEISARHGEQNYSTFSEGSTVGEGVAQADIPVTDEFGCRVVHIE